MKNKLFGLMLFTIGACFCVQADESLLFTKMIVKNNEIRTYSSQTAAPLTQTEKELVQYVQLSVDNAIKGISRLTPEVLAIQGMTAPKIKHFLNNICSYPGGRYLEIGCWKGSTFISALYKNEPFIHAAYGIDNWSEFGAPIVEFQANCNKFLTDVPFDFFSENCFTLDLKSLRMPINIYMYDGAHSSEDLTRAFTHFNPAFDDTFIAIVDDWNWETIRTGVFNAFRQLNYTVVYEMSLPAGGSGEGDVKNWWNGYYIAVIRKNK